MRYFIWLLLFFSINTYAQTNLKFDTRYIDAEDKWVSMPMNRDSTHNYGFVYLDNIAGLTFHLEGTYRISVDGNIILKKQPITQIIKQRLSVSNIKVAVIPSSMFKDLQIKEYPDWLKAYKNGENDISRLLKLGSTHNAWSQSEKALIYLKKVEQIDPKYKGLSYEHAFANNALKEYEKAILILDKALVEDPKNCELYKELLYAQMNLKQVDKAMQSSKIAYEVCSDKNFRMQILRDLMYHYYTKKDKEQFKIWADKAKIEMATVPGALQGIAKWEAELN